VLSRYQNKGARNHGANVKEISLRIAKTHTAPQQREAQIRLKCQMLFTRIWKAQDFWF